MGTLSKVFAKTYADKQAANTAFALTPDYTEQLDILCSIVSDLNEGKDFFAKLELSDKGMPMLTVGNGNSGATLSYEVSFAHGLSGNLLGIALINEIVDMRAYDLRKPEEVEEMCQDMAGSLQFSESRHPVFQKTSAYLKKKMQST